MSSGDQPVRRGVDGGGGGSDRLARGRPAHRAAQDGDDERTADTDNVGRLILPQYKGQSEHQRPRGAGEGSGAAFQCHALHVPPAQERGSTMSHVRRV